MNEGKYRLSRKEVLRLDGPNSPAAAAALPMEPPVYQQVGYVAR